MSADMFIVGSLFHIALALAGYLINYRENSNIHL